MKRRKKLVNEKKRKKLVNKKKRKKLVNEKREVSECRRWESRHFQE